MNGAAAQVLTPRIRWSGSSAIALRDFALAYQAPELPLLASASLCLLTATFVHFPPSEVVIANDAVHDENKHVSVFDCEVVRLTEPALAATDRVDGEWPS